jgi:hypothetical protein
MCGLSAQGWCEVRAMGSAHRRSDGAGRTRARAAKLPTPVLTGSGSKGVSQPTAVGTPASKVLFDHEAGWRDECRARDSRAGRRRAGTWPRRHGRFLRFPAAVCTHSAQPNMRRIIMSPLISDMNWMAARGTLSISSLPSQPLAAAGVPSAHVYASGLLPTSACRSGDCPDGSR